MQELSMTQVVSTVILGSVVLMGTKLRRIRSADGHQPTKVIFLICVPMLGKDFH